uniref:G_PROTEIN_RECEP_F1_2 domain-containing protein n=1 Tax=Caenorhabditis tropicalis TaxID=1561998 RepID=A0A1I7TVY9_9PELO
MLTVNNLRVKNNALSAKTLKLQRNLMIALTIQSLLHLIVLILPITTIAYILVFMLLNQKFNNLTILTLAFHGIISTIVMIVVHTPYREATFSWIPIGKSSSDRESQVEETKASHLVTC